MLLAAVEPGVPSSLAAVCSGGLAVCELLEQFVQQLLASDSASRWLPDEATLTYGPCVANPGKIICIGLNYRRHVEELGMTISALPVLFSKFSNTISAAGEEVFCYRQMLWSMTTRPNWALSSASERKASASKMP